MADDALLPTPVELPLPTGPAALDLRTQLVRFVLTGGLSALVDFGLLVLLMAAGLTHTPAKAVSFVAGTTTAYLINRRWTFRAEPSRRRFVAVVVLYALTFGLQVGLFSVLFDRLTGAGLSRLAVQVVAFVIAQGAATTVNFVVQRGVIFRLR
ncbi:GtrA family protein [uncultured Friedmanniella sp.]|uniref:GtrA family protein n=1 Tax=uncultured Friedmanniella sp. TaxID=335381 RepID=UPI0035CA1879